jgi:hypothetical protein
VKEWEPIPSAEIVADNSDIYDHWDPQQRKRIEDLENVPLLDDNGNEVNIFGSDGRRIARRNARGDEGDEDADQPLGVLVDLRCLDDFFFGETDDEEDSDTAGEVEPNNFAGRKYYVYPQAGTLHYGHVQSRVIPNVLDQYVQRLNDRITRPIPRHNVRPPRNNLDIDGDWGTGEFEYDEESDEEIVSVDSEDSSSDTEFQPGFGASVECRQRQVAPAAAVVATAIQAYNTAMHLIRVSATDHDAQQGQITAYIGGSYASSDKERSKRDRIRARLIGGMPHERFALKIRSPNVPRAFRVEVNYVLRLHQLKAEHRNGR